jgi:hypothetical protein
MRWHAAGGAARVAHAVLLALEAGEEPFDEACSRLWWDLAAHFGPGTPLPTWPACRSRWSCAAKWT